MRWIMITKTTMVVIFNLLNSHLSTLSSPTEEVFQVNGQNRLVANLPVIDFILSRKKCQHQSHRIRNFQFFFQYIGFLPLLGKFERRCLSAIRNFSVLAAIIQESADKQLVLRIVKTFLSCIHQPDRVAPKASDVSAADWLYQHTWKNTIFFHMCCYGFFSGPEIPV